MSLESFVSVVTFPSPSGRMVGEVLPAEAIDTDKRASGKLRRIVSDPCVFRTVSAGRKRTVESVNYSMGVSGHFDTPGFQRCRRTWPSDALLPASRLPVTNPANRPLVSIEPWLWLIKSTHSSISIVYGRVADHTSTIGPYLKVGPCRNPFDERDVFADESGSLGAGASVALRTLFWHQ
jgi:hypothetical protein